MVTHICLDSVHVYTEDYQDIVTQVCIPNLVPGLGFRLTLGERIKFNSFSFTLLRTKIHVHRHTVSRHIQTAKTKKV